MFLLVLVLVLVLEPSAFTFRCGSSCQLYLENTCSPDDETPTACCRGGERHQIKPEVRRFCFGSNSKGFPDGLVPGIPGERGALLGAGVSPEEFRCNSNRCRILPSLRKSDLMDTNAETRTSQ
ncbi:hypothetical protein FQA47_005562 [Oryzias melastigma]|uniref:UPAR/Ly6 domain-containing protein n=1 Tax=Oryzias melastigma TaxID=30732 RepID=A0A834CDI1_ORYME|nr:hypothetical protein FQA47_005562 [Oryzias melastigma]